MKKFKSEDFQLITKTILSGLPGVGKSFFTGKLCEKFFEDTGISLECVSSDDRSREVRKDPHHPVTTNFMKTHKIPQEDFPLLIKTSAFMKKYGEPCFRDLESDIIVHMLENGEFSGKIASLGGKAVLHPRTAEALKKYGYNIIYLRNDVNIISKYISSDFERALDGTPITRSNINDKILNDVSAATTPDIAKKSAPSFIRDRLKKMKNKILNKNTHSPVEKRELRTFFDRIKARDASSKKIMTDMYNERNELYENAASTVIELSGNIEKDMTDLIKNIKSSNSNMAINMNARMNKGDCR